MPPRASNTKPSLRAPPEHEGAVVCFRSSEIDTYWSQFAHHLERFEKETDELTIPWVREELKATRKQLWGFDDGERISLICVTEISGLLCWLWAVCGTETFPGQIERGVAAIEKWAQEMGCKKLKIRGRLGWERRLKGFKRSAIILERDL